MHKESIKRALTLLVPNLESASRKKPPRGVSGSPRSKLGVVEVESALSLLVKGRFHEGFRSSRHVLRLNLGQEFLVVLLVASHHKFTVARVVRYQEHFVAHHALELDGELFIGIDVYWTTEASHGYLIGKRG